MGIVETYWRVNNVKNVRDNPVEKSNYLLSVTVDPEEDLAVP